MPVKREREKMRDYSEILRELRKEKNISQKTLSEAIGCTERTIRYYEARERRPDLDVLIRIAQYFDVSLDYLAGLEEEKK